MALFKVVNVTDQAMGGRGSFLDLGAANGNKTFGVGRHVLLEAKDKRFLPDCVLAWRDQGLVKIVDAESDDTLPETANDITPKSVNPVEEAKASEEDFDDVPALTEAVPARLSGENTGPMEGSTAQMQAKVTDAAAEERYSTDLSPIPGDQPKSVDESEAFTIRAPKSKSPGSVVKSK
jgi:hypothetical protein